MKTSVLHVLAFALIVATIQAREAALTLTGEVQHLLQKRQITVRPPAGCVFYECRARCIRQGYKNGGICTMTGCHCVR
ncbi:hypothetical protein EVAR_92081_1 [Eumeta japonica]|uniref:Invertebrate defensins family profile domain-containing protein n=1 Tax=Eumeta variegata TaxID=151549 RepID=A0A4C1T151_EUMVA|nr:hypothetical protein EVAR_92081_1 [Eumeta japonica]